MEQSADFWRFFRFRKINDFLWQEIELAELYCCEPSRLNDPFDCQIDVFDSLSRAMNATPAGVRRDTLEHILDQFRKHDPRSNPLGVSCFSKTMENPLMWSHYADSHTGVCLMYDFPHNYFSERYNSSTEQFYMAGCAPVNYGDDAYFDWLTAGDLNDPIQDHPTINAAAQLLKTKSDCWRYEEEARIITSVPGHLGFEHSFLRQVTFGIRTSQKHKDLVHKVVSRNSPHAAFVQADRKEGADFGLEFRDL